MLHHNYHVKEEVAMSNQLFNPIPVDFRSEPLFLGEGGRNISRLELDIEQHIMKQAEDAIGKYWIPTEFPYADDAKTYTKMPIELQELFLKNLKFQTLLDSIAARSVTEVFMPIVTNPQLEFWFQQHGFFECNIHSKTYAEIIKAMPVDSMKVFDDIMINPNILNRAKHIISYFEDTVIWNARRLLNHDYDLDEHKRSIILSLYALNILEAGLFKSSFLTSFAFKENGYMTACADAITRISMDETSHYAMTMNLLNRLRVDPSWSYIFAEVQTEAERMYVIAADADFDWIDYLFEDGPQLLGISNTVLKQYVKYNSNKIMKSVGLPQHFEDTFNPCSWANKYDKMSNVQTAQKEKVSGNYELGTLNSVMTADDWKDLQ